VGPDLTTATGAVAASRSLRYLSAVLLFAIGALHLEQYFSDHYQPVPVIGALFAANFAIAVLLGLALLAPLELIPRLWRPLLNLAALGGIGFAAGVIIGLELSETGTLFGFHEDRYRLAITLSIVFEAAVIVFLAAFLALEAKANRHHHDPPHWARSNRTTGRALPGG